ncbi:hypothetical protein [Streptomyces flavofungini]|uniref:hypothetical protein n=1 Tax=Streptomyces flavofungini TaxID=68200 RepID=UPI0025AFCC75|nr:hypothetical protein [Streptomyces flavofungini]WJV48521.1 hypothetical protein QUY26_25170 [Streptomyces flavofungini]
MSVPDRAPSGQLPADETPLDGTPLDDVSDGVTSGGGAAPERLGLTPRQARRLRIAAASLLMATAAVLLAVRLASRSSVLVVGVYGLLLILCGLVIELSRRGRTRLGSYLLATGLVAALLMDVVVLS